MTESAAISGRIGRKLRLRILKNVSPEPEAYSDGETNERDSDFVDDNKIAAIGQRALGSRNRWAVIVLDGNSIGRHFKTLREKLPDQEANYLGLISKEIRQTTEQAFDDALTNVITKWFNSIKHLASDRYLTCLRTVRAGGSSCPSDQFCWVVMI